VKLEGEKNLPVSYYGYIFPLRGGGKKRKKKNYTKPKKIKHVRKKAKLKVLNYYSVSENLVLRLRKESPESPGCFMANHKDRITCGKTSITFVRTSFI
jgi:small subunit ribosomal protein S27Ae